MRCVFFLSGLAGLFYQIIWLRLLSAVFGNTTLALSVCLTAFMAGLALGSYVLGRWADRVVRPFRLYALLEIGIGLYGVLSPQMLAAVRASYLALAGRLPLDSLPLLCFQFLACFLVLLIPTALMGGTLPAVSKGLVRQLEGIAQEVGWLYGLNTLGAALGVLLVGFFLLPTIGLRASLALAALVNLAVGIYVLRLERSLPLAGGQAPPSSKHSPASASRPVRGSRRTAPAASSPGGPSRVLLGILILGFGLSGFAGLALEVAWSRALCLFTGSSVYAFSAVLFAVLVGIALGSVLLGRLAARRQITLNWFIAVQLGAGATTLALVLVYNWLPHAFLHLVARLQHSYPLLLAAEVLLILAYLLPPTMLSGAAFPVLSRLYVREQSHLSGSVGLLYAANTVGCILGAFFAGFLLIPTIGLRATVLLCASLYIITGAAVLLNGARRAQCAGLAALAVLAGAWLALPAWRQDLMSAGLFTAVRTGPLPRTPFKVTYYREGSVCTVSVLDVEDGRVLKVNGKTDASSIGSDRDTQIMTAHLPLLLADRADSVLVVGLGCGASAGSASLHPVRRVDCVEIEPAVAEAARYFTHINHNVFSDPRFHLIFADARNYLAATSRRYDVITSEPSNPWVAGVASLFTVEHFRACRARLSDDGVICQWLHIYGMSPQDVCSIIASFVRVFPESTLWGVDRGCSDLVLVARKRPWKVDFHGLATRLRQRPQVQEDLGMALLESPAALVSSLLMGPADLRRLARTGRLNTDDLPLLEFSAPRNMYRLAAKDENLAMFARFHSQPLEEIVEFGPARRDAAAREALATAFMFRYQVPQALLPTLKWVRAELAGAVALAPRQAALYEKLADVERLMGDLASARAHARKAIELQPGSEGAREILSDLDRAAGASQNVQP